MSPKTVFSDGNPALGIKGTKVTAAFLNASNTHYHTGLDVDGDGSLAYAVATGTNDLTLTLAPALTQYVNGMPIYLKAAATNTGAMTLNVNGLGAKAIKKNASEALVAGDVRSGAVITVAYDGTNFQMVATPNADTVDGYHAGNASGNVPVSNGTVNTNLNADMVDGRHAGVASGIPTLDADTRLVEAANKISDGTNAIHFKIIDIGDWNMDTTIAVNINHGLDASKIRAVSAVVRPDSPGTNIYPVTPGPALDATSDISAEYVSSTFIQFKRRAGGVFDNASFSATSYNRGWITITYVE